MKATELDLYVVSADETKIYNLIKEGNVISFQNGYPGIWYKKKKEKTYDNRYNEDEY